MATLIGVTVGCLRFIHAPLAPKKQAEVESASGLVCLGEIVRLSPRQPAVCAIAIPIRIWLWRDTRWCERWFGPLVRATAA